MSDDFKRICSVSGMARKLGLSRARFYQLQDKGVFPMPVYCPRSRRPFYPMNLQEQCLEIRKTGIACNGQPILFNTSRKRKAGRPQKPLAHRYQGLVDALGQMGLSVSHGRVAEAVGYLYPEGLTDDRIDGTALVRLFQYLEGRR